MSYDEYHRAHLADGSTQPHTAGGIDLNAMSIATGEVWPVSGAPAVDGGGCAGPSLPGGPATRLCLTDRCRPPTAASPRPRWGTAGRWADPADRRKPGPWDRQSADRHWPTTSGACGGSRPGRTDSRRRASGGGSGACARGPALRPVDRNRPAPGPAGRRARRAVARLPAMKWAESSPLARHTVPGPPRGRHRTATHGINDKLRSVRSPSSRRWCR